MRVTAKSDYALRALIEIPHGFLQAILADLRRSGVVIAQRGQSGGWRLSKDAADISVADVIRAVDGPLVSVYGLRPEAVNYNETASVLQLVWIAGRSSLRDVFEQVSVRQLAEGKMPKAVTSRTADDDAWQSH
jgi:Rrf2 family protein